MNKNAKGNMASTHRVEKCGIIPLPNHLIWTIPRPGAGLIWCDLWHCYGTWLPIGDPHGISIVFFYGIAMYLAEFHMFPIFYGMGFIQLSPIPIPYDLWPLIMEFLRIWQNPIHSPYLTKWHWYGSASYQYHMLLPEKSHTTPNCLVTVVDDVGMLWTL